MNKIKLLQEEVKILREREVMVSGMIEALNDKVRVNLGFDRGYDDYRYADIKDVLWTVMRHLGIQVEFVPGKLDGLKVVEEKDDTTKPKSG